MKKRHERHLSKRDIRILEFVIRYRVGTESLISKACFSDADSVANVSRVLRRLEKRGMLSSQTFVSGLNYYTATRRGLKLLGFTSRTPRPLTEQSLPVALAVAEYCVACGNHRVTSQEFQDTYPELWWPGSRASNYVFVRDDKGLVLRMLLVDRGGAARRIRSRVRRVIAQRSRLREFSLLMKAGRFEIVVLTGLPQQQAKIDRHIARSSFGAVRVTSALVPGLAEVLTLRR